MDGDRIWERQENESVRDYEYFRIYLLSPPARANPFPPLLPVCGTVIFVPFADDSQVISATLEKLQSPEPRLEIEIYELTPSTTTPLETATR